MSAAPTDNLSIALGVITDTDWLTQTDRVNEATFKHFLRHGRYLEACEFMLGHLSRTEVTRTRAGGPALPWAEAVAALEECAHQLVAGGVNATRPPVVCSGPAGPKGAPTNAVPSAAGPCATGDSPTLRVIDGGEDCGHVSPDNGMRCVSAAHGHNPDGHYYQSASGSHVPDRHTANEHQED